MITGKLPSKVDAKNVEGIVEQVLTAEETPVFACETNRGLKRFLAVFTNMRIIFLDPRSLDITDLFYVSEIENATFSMNSLHLSSVEKGTSLFGVHKSDIENIKEFLKDRQIGSMQSGDFEKLKSQERLDKRLAENENQLQEKLSLIREKDATDPKAIRRREKNAARFAEVEAYHAKVEARDLAEKIAQEEFTNEYGNLVTKARIGWTQVKLFDKGYVSFNSQKPEKLVSAESTINVSKKTGPGRALGVATSLVLSGGLTASGGGANRRGDVYLVIVTDQQVRTLHEDLNSVSSASKGYESEKAVLTLEAAAQEIIDRNKPSEVEVATADEAVHSLISGLENLVNLHSVGALTDEEFSLAKAKLLGNQ